jgi:hypothetical protein
MPRQYQEHPSWPGERVPLARPVSATPSRRIPGVPPGPGPVGPVPVGPVSSGPVGAGYARAAHHTGTHHTGSMAPVSQRPGPSRPPTTSTTGGIPRVPAQRGEYSANPADIAQFSAVPYSAMPYSGAPYSPLPYSAAPYSVAPQSLAPNSAIAPSSAYLQSRGARGSQPQQHSQPPPKPRYRDDAYSTGARPLYSYDHSDSAAPPDGYQDEPDRDETRRESRPAYPESWGAAPSRPSRPEWTSGPRARFSR